MIHSLSHKLPRPIQILLRFSSPADYIVKCLRRKSSIFPPFYNFQFINRLTFDYQSNGSWNKKIIKWCEICSASSETAPTWVDTTFNSIPDFNNLKKVLYFIYLSTEKDCFGNEKKGIACFYFLLVTDFSKYLSFQFPEKKEFFVKASTPSNSFQQIGSSQTYLNGRQGSNIRDVFYAFNQTTGLPFIILLQRHRQQSRLNFLLFVI